MSLAEVTGNIPRPAMAISSGCDVVISAPFSSIARREVDRTPPAEYRPEDRVSFSTNASKSVSTRL